MFMFCDDRHKFAFSRGYNYCWRACRKKKKIYICYNIRCYFLKIKFKYALFFSFVFSPNGLGSATLYFYRLPLNSISRIFFPYPHTFLISLAIKFLTSFSVFHFSSFRRQHTTLPLLILLPRFLSSLIHALAISIIHSPLYFLLFRAC